MLDLQTANRMVAVALAEGRKRALRPLSVAILDAGGHLLAFQREDGSSILRPEIAMGKAASALALGVSSREIAKMAADRPAFIQALSGIAPKGLIPAAGGVLVRDAESRVIGAIGVTGDISEEDEACALAAIEDFTAPA